MCFAATKGHHTFCVEGARLDPFHPGGLSMQPCILFVQAMFAQHSGNNPPASNGEVIGATVFFTLLGAAVTTGIVYAIYWNSYESGRQAEVDARRAQEAAAFAAVQAA